MPSIQLITMFTLLIYAIADVNVDNDDIRIVKGPKNTTACAHQNASIFCGFTGSDPNQQIVFWQIIWRNESGSVVRDEIIPVYDIPNNPELHLVWVIDNESGRNNSPNSKLVVNPADNMYNQSSFQCLIRLANGNNISSSVGTLTVEGPPVIHDDDIFVNDNEVCLHDFTIRWKSSSSIVCGIAVKYNILLDFGILKKVNTTTFYTFYNFTGLQSDLTYTFTVFGTNRAGEGKAVTEVFSTSKLIEGPTIFRVESCLTDITVHWSAVNSSSCGGVLYYTVVLYRDFRSTSTYITTNLYYNFTGLDSGTTYSVVLTATNRAGNGSWSSAMPVETLKPKDTRLFANSSKSLIDDNDYNISWIAPPVDRCTPPITGYIVIISFNGHTLSSRILPSNVTSIMMSEYFSNHPLGIEIEYGVTVVAINSDYKFIPVSISAGSKNSFPEICIITTAAPASLFAVLFVISFIINVSLCYSKKHKGNTSAN